MQVFRMEKTIKFPYKMIRVWRNRMLFSCKYLEWKKTIKFPYKMIRVWRNILWVVVKS